MTGDKGDRGDRGIPGEIGGTCVCHYSSPLAISGHCVDEVSAVKIFIMIAANTCH